MPAAAKSQVQSSISDEQLEQLKSFAEQEGGGTFWVTSTKLNEIGTGLHTRRDWMRLDEVSNARDWCAEWGGGGRYLVQVWSPNAQERKRPLATFKLDVDLTIPAVPVEELRARAKAAAEAQQQVAAQAATPWGAPPWAAQAGAPVGWRNPWQQQQLQPQDQSQQIFYLQEQIRAAKEEASEARRSREASERENGLRNEMRDMKNAFATTLEKLTQPTKQASPISEVAAAFAPVLAAYMQGRTESDKARAQADQQMQQLIMAIATKDQTAPLMAAMERTSSTQAAADAKNTELLKMVTDLATRDKSEGMVKILSATTQMSQAMVATMGTIMDKAVGDAEPAWKEPLGQVVTMFSNIVEATTQKAIAESQPPPKLGSAAPANGTAAPARLPAGATEQQKVQVAALQTVEKALAGNASIRAVNLALIEYCEIVRERWPNDSDVQLFWGDHQAGVRRLLSSYLGEKGGPGSSLLTSLVDDINAAVERYESEEEQVQDARGAAPG